MGQKIDVIVPCYKVERYLHKCVNSILLQTYTNLEIILVDANLHEVDLLNPMYITINISNASESMTLEDLERYEFTRKINKDAEIARLQTLKARYMSLNKEVQDDVALVMQQPR